MAYRTTFQRSYARPGTRAVIDVDNTVVVDIFLGVTNTVTVEIPASDTVAAVRSIATRGSRCTVVAVAAA
jgi:hypothetical protein